MRFLFDELKTTQAAAYLIGRAGGSMNYMKLIKLLYLADRASLLLSGEPITGAKYVSMERGPVLSEVLDLIKRPQQDRDQWCRFIEKEGYDVCLVNPAGDSELSDFEVRMLESTFEKYGSYGSFRLVDISHHPPEWRQPNIARRSIPLSPEEILEAGGKDSSEIARIAEQAEYHYHVKIKLGMGA